MADAQGGRIPDEAVAWYCHARLRKMIDAGTTQEAIADAADVSPAAVSHLMKHGRGVGLSTASAFAQVLGFAKRGQLVDAADEWWVTREAQAYVLKEVRRIAKEREAKLLKEKNAPASSKRTA